MTMTRSPSAKRDRLSGLLLGGAIGDALGLPAEGLSPARQRRWWPGDLRHRFVFRRGMISDDTEHAFMTAQALLAARGDVWRFRHALAWKLRWWFVALPAGVGLATARSCVRLWFGVPPERSGLNSAGNGPAMRSAIIGAVFADDAERRRAYVRASTRLTHIDPRAETAALAVAEAAAWIVRRRRGNETPLLRHPGELEPPHVGSYSVGSAPDILEHLRRLTDEGEWRTVCDQLRASLDRGDSPRAFGKVLGFANGVTGYAFHTVPFALFACLRHRGDYRRTLASAIRCGGDTDTVGAIAGALAGCDVGREGIPVLWLNGLRDWPRSATLPEEVAVNLTDGPDRPVRRFWPGVIPRNLFLFAIIMLHGLRRLLPPF